MSLKQFIKRYEALKRKFPRLDRTYNNVENCDYSENVFNSKDSYWCFNGAELNGCLYNTDGYKEVDDIECDNGVLSERCFESTDFAECTDCYYVTQCVRCYNVWYSYMCTDCNDCFGCSNLFRKSYCILNIQYTKEEYEKKMLDIKKVNLKIIYNKLNVLKLKFPRINAYYDDTQNSEYADYVFFVKNMYYCFDDSHSEDCGYMELSHYCNDIWNGLYALESERSAEIFYSNNCYGGYEIFRCSRCYDSYYLYECFDCHNCFGCAYLTNKDYCILNIQYTKEEYEKKLKELKKELGIYFDSKK